MYEVVPRPPRPNKNLFQLHVTKLSNLIIIIRYFSIYSKQMPKQSKVLGPTGEGEVTSLPRHSAGVPMFVSCYEWGPAAGPKKRS